jgi:nickel-dependent lactate racemase
MGMTEFTLKYGRGTVSFEIPEEQVLYEIMGRNMPALSDLAGAYREALRHPIDAPPLRELARPGEKAAILVSDITRGWQRNDLTLPILVETLNEAGVADEDITIVIAVGAHRTNTADEFVEICSAEVCHRVRVINHDARDPQSHVYLGKTSRGTEVSVNKIVKEVDRVILTGGVIYHYMVGYGGGRKSIMPGISSLETIQQCHMWAMAPEVGQAVNPNSESRRTRGNEAHEDMVEVAAFVNPDFLANVVVNLDGEIAGVFAGHWMTAWEEGCRLVDSMCGVEIEEEADIVIASGEGYPRDINLYQGSKIMDNARYAMKQGGVAVIVAECADMAEPPDFFQWFDYPDILSMEKALREDLTIAGWTALKQWVCHQKGSYVLLTGPENDALARKANCHPVTTIEEALEVAYRECGSAKPRITIMPQASNTFPILKKKQAGTNPGNPGSKPEE